MLTSIGIPFTWADALNQQKSYLKFAEDFGKRIRAWLNYRKALSGMALTGRSKPSLNMHMNGSPRSGGSGMEMHTVMGFLRLLLSENESMAVIERSMENRRCLIPREVSYLLGREIKRTVTEMDSKAMESCWLAFCKENNVDQATMLGEFGDMRTFEKWFAWVAKNYHDPLPQASPWDN